jgi:hypothetical protein
MLRASIDVEVTRVDAALIKDQSNREAEAPSNQSQASLLDSWIAKIAALNTYLVVRETRVGQGRVLIRRRY